jgi:hypothetical protein
MMVEKNPSSDQSTQRRRSTRIVQTVPMTVTGTDALGQPFKERTSALIINCHGCKYQSKHFVMKDSWVTFEIAHPEPGKEPRRARAKVVWVQRPRTVQELFQIAAQLEISGNIWGVAFPPDDWFPYAEDQAPVAEIPAPGAPAAQTPAGPSASQTLVIPPAAPGKVAMMPGPALTGETAASIERHIQRLLTDARGQIQKSAREAASAAVTAETGNLLREVEAQLRAAAKKAIESVAGPYVDEAVRQALDQFQKNYTSQTLGLQEQWKKGVESQLAQATDQMVARMGETGVIVQSEFDLKVRSSMDQAAAQLSEIEHRMMELRTEIAAGTAASQARLQAVNEQVDAAVAQAAQQWRERLNLQEEESLAHLKALEEGVRKLKEEIAAATDNEIPQIHRAWREQLETDMALAGTDWNNLVQSAMTGASEQMSTRLSEMAQHAAMKTERDIAVRIGHLKKAFEQSAADAVKTQVAARSEIEKDLYRARDSMDALTAAAAQADEHRAKSEALLREAAVQLDQQYQNLMGAHSAALQEKSSTHLAEMTSKANATLQALSEQAAARLRSMEETSDARLRALTEAADAQLAAMAQKNDAHLVEMNARSGAIINTMADQLKPAFDSRAQESLAQFLHHVENELAPRLESARQACRELASGEKRAEEALFTQTEKLLRASEENIRVAEAKLQEILTQVHKDFENISRVTLEKRVEELDAKSADAQHGTFEALYKAAEWYQKKAQAAMQAALEKGVEQASGQLRDHAGEVSRLFSQELDHYSRSYTEHTQAQLEESSKDMVERARSDMSQAHQTQAASFSDDVHRIAREKLGNFAEESSGVRDEMATQLEAHANKVKARWAEHAGQSFTEFQDQLAVQLTDSLGQAQKEFQASLLPILDSWRADREAQHKEWLEHMAAATAEGAEQYRQKLDNVSNTWMFASVTTLNQHSHNVIEALQKTAEQRLRATCSNVLNGLAEAMRKQLLGISAELAGPANGPANGKTNGGSSK